MINKIGWPHRGSPICLIMSMITDWIRLHSFLLPINHNFNKRLFLKSKHKKFQVFFAGNEKKKPFKHAWWRVLSNYLGLTCTVLLRLKSGQLIMLITNQIWEFCYSYDYCTFIIGEYIVQDSTQTKFVSSR